MREARPARRRFVMTAGAVLLLLTAVPAYAAGPFRGLDGTVRLETDTAVGNGVIDHRVHRLVRRAENTSIRLVTVLTTVGTVWVWVLVSALAFLLVVAVSSAVDLRMLALRRKGLGALARDLAHGMLTFLRILRDRRTPNLARLVLAVALVYWLLPTDLFPDDTMVPGFIDDVLIAIAAAKGFVYLCPDSLVARHAAAVEAHA